jgi:DNA-3-methyladenine glycosylase I
LVNRWRDSSEVPASTQLSDRMSKELKKRGFRFVGTTICYSLLQAPRNSSSARSARIWS